MPTCSILDECMDWDHPFELAHVCGKDVVFSVNATFVDGTDVGCTDATFFDDTSRETESEACR